jgi:3-oxoacyl-[acyl-carrier protein] reductase
VKLGLEGRVAVVGGSSAGLGFAVARRLALEGARVLVTGRNPEGVERAVEQIRDEVGSAQGLAVDLSLEDGPQRVIDTARERLGEVDIVVTNAGGPPAMAAVDATAQDLSAACSLLLLPVQRFVAAALPHMRRQRWGRIVAITSVTVLDPQPGLVLSTSLRAAVSGYLKSVADEVAADGVTVNSVCPGFTATDRLKELAGVRAQSESMTSACILARWAHEAPLKRILEPDELAAAVTFLCSEPASGITGVALPVDGGLSRSLL